MKRVTVKIKELCERNEISQRSMATLTGIRHATLSELSNSKRQNINFEHIVKIAQTFDITDIREIIDLED